MWKQYRFVSLETRLDILIQAPWLTVDKKERYSNLNYSHEYHHQSHCMTRMNSAIIQDLRLSGTEDRFDDLKQGFGDLAHCDWAATVDFMFFKQRDS
eukprot:scaffold991_cov279-Chaetoceros_neogracile.AAC.9